MVFITFLFTLFNPLSVHQFGFVIVLLGVWMFFTFFFQSGSILDYVLTTSSYTLWSLVERLDNPNKFLVVFKFEVSLVTQPSGRCIFLSRNSTFIFVFVYNVPEIPQGIQNAPGSFPKFTYPCDFLFFFFVTFTPPSAPRRPIFNVIAISPRTAADAGVFSRRIILGEPKRNK